MKVIVDLGFDITSLQTLRFYGINTPEMKGKDKINGKISRDWLRNKIDQAIMNSKFIIVKTHKDKKGKYGRLLAEVFIENEEKSLNEQMLTLGLAVEYI